MLFLTCPPECVDQRHSDKWSTSRHATVGLMKVPRSVANNRPHEITAISASLRTQPDWLQACAAAAAAAVELMKRQRCRHLFARRPTAVLLTPANIALTELNRNRLKYRVKGKKAGHRLITIILSNLNRFKKCFSGRFLGKFAANWIITNPTTTCTFCYTTL